MRLVLRSLGNIGELHRLLNEAGFQQVGDYVG